MAGDGARFCGGRLPAALEKSKISAQASVEAFQILRGQPGHRKMQCAPEGIARAGGIHCGVTG